MKAMREIKKNLANLFYFEPIELTALLVIGLMMIDQVIMHKTTLIAWSCVVYIAYICYIVYSNIKVEKYITENGIEDKRLVLNSIENLDNNNVKLGYRSDSDSNFRASIILPKEDYASYVADFGVKNKVGESEEVCVDKSGKVLDCIYDARVHVINNVEFGARETAMIMLLLVNGTLLGF